MFLAEIIELKKKHLEITKQERDFEELKKSAFQIRENKEKHLLKNALQKNQINIIAEFKRASPSKGIINDKIDIAETVKKYEKGGACAISILTEEDKFKGSLNDLKKVKDWVSIPVLRKDFIFEEFQIYEAAEAGSDAVLLIAAMLDDTALQKLYRLALEDLRIDALVEVHTVEELERVKKIGAKIIGINNRDLKSFNVSLDVSRRLIKLAPEDSFVVSESGLSKKDEILELKALGFSGFLIGETLMKSGNILSELKQLTEAELK